MSNELIVIGKIVAPHGVRGDVRVTPLTDYPDRFLTMKEVLVGEKSLLPIETAKFHKQSLLLKFKGFDDRNAVETLRDKLLYVRREDAVPLSEGNYYIFDLVGLKVYTTDDVFIGTLSDVFATGSNDVYVIDRQDERPLMLPALKKIVTSIDVTDKKMIIRPLEEWDADED